MDMYQDLAEAVMSACPPDYNQVYLDAEMYDNSASMSLKCRDGRGNEVTSDFPEESSIRVLLGLQRIREEMAKQAGEMWKSCVFTIDGSGHFNFQVSYDSPNG